VSNPTVLRQPDNWRKAVELSRAPFVKLLCADDLLHPRCLELQVPLPQSLAAFRVGAHSLSAENESSIYDDQRAIMDQVAATPQLGIRAIDRAAGRLGAPMGRLRRRTLFALSAQTSRRAAQRVRPRAEASADPISSCGS
jgi:hypothetical protein